MAFSTENSKGMQVLVLQTPLTPVLLLISKLLIFLSLGFPIWTVELSLATTKTKDGALK